MPGSGLETAIAAAARGSFGAVVRGERRAMVAGRGRRGRPRGMLGLVFEHACVLPSLHLRTTATATTANRQRNRHRPSRQCHRYAHLPTTRIHSTFQQQHRPSWPTVMPHNGRSCRTMDGRAAQWTVVPPVEPKPTAAAAAALPHLARILPSRAGMPRPVPAPSWTPPPYGCTATGNWNRCHRRDQQQLASCGAFPRALTRDMCAS